MDLLQEFLKKFPCIRDESEQRELIRVALVLFLDTVSQTSGMLANVDLQSIKHTIQTMISCRPNSRKLTISQLCSRHSFMDFKTKSDILDRKIKSVVHKDDPNVLAKQLLSGSLRHFIPSDQHDKELWYDPKWL